MTNYGKKGGASATAGKRAETIVDACGVRKRVFHGQRWLLVQQRDENDAPMVRAFHTQEKAAALLDYDAKHHGPFDVEYVAPASPA